MEKTRNIVVNWHITEKCNYSCRFCFAKWGKQPEVWDNFENAKKIIDNLAKFWQPDYRLNFVGGEPLLFAKKILPIMEYAASFGMNISVQTNGSRLEILKPVAKHVSQIGVSIDSWNHDSNKKIGRCCGEKTLSFEGLQTKINSLRNVGGTFKLKINTVASEWNWQDCVVPQMTPHGCDRIKILRQMPFGDSMGVSDEQFYYFIRNNYVSELPIYIEDNELMTESYLMIAPNGKLFQNGNGSNYKYSDSLLNTDFSLALSQINFNIEKFGFRYNTDRTMEIVNYAFNAMHKIEKKSA